MRNFRSLLVLLILIACSKGNELLRDMEMEEEIELTQNRFLLSWKARKAVEHILKQMPCGWPEYGVPPLAPYENNDLKFSINLPLLSISSQLAPLRIEGLNDMEIVELTVSYIFKKIAFNFIFPKLVATGKFSIEGNVELGNLTGQEPKLFINGNGDLDFVVQNLRVEGSMKYKLPIFFGSARIEDLKLDLSVDDVDSNLSGFVNGVPITGPVNDLVTEHILSYFNDYASYLGSFLKTALVPVINDQLEGKTLWHILWWAITKSHGTQNECQAFASAFAKDELLEMLNK